MPIYNVYLVGITGGSGAGKTTVLHAIMSAFSEAEIGLLSQDNYYKLRSEQEADENGVLNFDLPTSIDEKKYARDVALLKAGSAVQLKEYTFNNALATARQITIKPKPILLVEGIFVFYYKKIASLLDYRVFIQVSEEERLRRRIKRDLEERNYPEDDVRYRFEHHVTPTHNKYILPYKGSANLVIDNETDYRPDTDKLIAHLKQVLTSA